LLLWREQKRTGVFPTRCMPKSVRNPCNRIGKVRAVVRCSSEKATLIQVGSGENVALVALA